jgi:predicted flap endonuclease-1-like 5' DNA nuclease
MAFRRKSKQAETTFEEVPEPGTMTLVLEPGHVKHVHFDGRGLPAEPAPAPEPAVVEPAPAPVLDETPPAPAPAAEPAKRSFWRRKKVYETDRGNQVVAYDGEEGRSFATTGPHGERPFDPASDVDPLVKDVQLQAPRTVEHVYHEVIPLSAPPAAPAPAALDEAWEPTGTARRTVTETRTVRRAPRKTARKAKKVDRKKAVRAVRKAKRGPRRPHTDFPGDDHLVIDLEGIGPVYAKRLQKQGVYTTSRLAYEKPGNLAKRIKAPKKLVKNWRNMAELIKAKGIGKQYAEVLVRSGVKGIDDLKKRKPAKLAKDVNKFLRSVDSTVIGTAVHEGRAKQWIKAAKPMRRRVLPVPRKGPPQTETVKGFIERVPKYGVKPKKAAKKATKSRKAAKRPARKATKGRKKR